MPSVTTMLIILTVITDQRGLRTTPNHADHITPATSMRHAREQRITQMKISGPQTDSTLCQG